MTNALTAAEIRDRVWEEGNDALEETVLLKRSTSGTRHVYHDAEEGCLDPMRCEYRAGPEKLSRREARTRGLAPCAQCLVSPNSSPDHNYEPQLIASYYDPSRHETVGEAAAEYRKREEAD